MLRKIPVAAPLPVLHRHRRHGLAGKESGGESLLRIGTCLRKLLNQLPQSGYLFPKMNAWASENRSSEFSRRCKMLGIEGRSLHSYRYAWAQRARAAGKPPRAKHHSERAPRVEEAGCQKPLSSPEHPAQPQSKDSHHLSAARRAPLKETSAKVGLGTFRRNK